MSLNYLEIKRQLLHVFIGTVVLFLLIIKLLTPLDLFLIIVISAILSIFSKWFRVPVVQWFLDNFEREKDKKSFPVFGPAQVEGKKQKQKKMSQRVFKA